MTIAIIRNVPSRFNGFLASCMLEIAPHVYVAPVMKKSVRERLWNVMLDWSELIDEEGGVLLLWRNPDAPSGIGVRILGWPKKEFIDYEGLWLTHRNLTKQHDTEELDALHKIEKSAPHPEDPERDTY